jgi:hypothetical protein
MSDPPLSQLQQSIVDSLGELTLRKTAQIGLRHARDNRPHVVNGVDALSGLARERGSAIVIAAGPSLHRQSTIRRMLKHGYRGVVVATDGAMNHCLREGLVPDYVVSLDPHPTRIVRWFGDRELAARAEDQYFRRQELDPAFTRNELEVNRRAIELVDRHGPQMTAVLATSVSPTVTDRVREARMPVFWWNPMYDDPSIAGGVTRQARAIAPVPAMATGGNCGTAAWVFAGAILEAPTVVVVGMDLGYMPGTPVLNTQYSAELQDIFGEQFASAFINVPNPHTNETWFTDPTYWWYRQTFLQMAALAPFPTVNCTGGGILFGDGVEWQDLDRFLSS